MPALVQIGSKVPKKAPPANGADRFLPTNLREAHARGWDELDIVLVNGDAYVDHPTFGVPLVARLLAARGFRVGIISQPRWDEKAFAEDFSACGRPRLFFGVSSGNMDSMVNHYTAAKKRRDSDAYTPAAAPGQRPDYATAVYARRLKKLYPDVPVVIGGVEAGANHKVLGSIPRRYIIGLLPGYVDLRLARPLETAHSDVSNHADNYTIMVSDIDVAAKRAFACPVATNQRLAHDRHVRSVIRVAFGDVAPLK